MSSDEQLVTTDYVLVETFAIVHRRLGTEAVRVLGIERAFAFGSDSTDQGFEQVRAR